MYTTKCCKILLNPCNDLVHGFKPSVRAALDQTWSSAHPFRQGCVELGLCQQAWSNPVPKLGYTLIILIMICTQNLVLKRLGVSIKSYRRVTLRPQNFFYCNDDRLVRSNFRLPLDLPPMPQFIAYDVVQIGQSLNHRGTLYIWMWGQITHCFMTIHPSEIWVKMKGQKYHGT